MGRSLDYFPGSPLDPIDGSPSRSNNYQNYDPIYLYLVYMLKSGENIQKYFIGYNTLYFIQNDKMGIRHKPFNPLFDDRVGTPKIINVVTMSKNRNLC